MRWKGALLAAATAATALLASVPACAGPPPTHALVVRHPERKCALVRFSGCAALLGEPASAVEDEADAGSE